MINNGDFTGLDSIPMWTERDILDYLEIESYEYPQPENMDNNAWLLQQYQIINLLRWTTKRLHQSIATVIEHRDVRGVKDPSKYSGCYYGYQVDSWNELKQYIVAMEWILATSGDYFTFCYGGISITDLSGNFKEGYIAENRFKFTIPIQSVPYDWYIYPVVSFKNDFYPIGLGKYGPNKFCLMGSSDGLSEYIQEWPLASDFDDLQSPETYLSEPTNIGDNYKIYSVGNEGSQASSNGTIYYGQRLVLKFTGDNGFKFRGTDW
jgi:hypothetical protein